MKCLLLIVSALTALSAQISQAQTISRPQIPEPLRRNAIIEVANRAAKDDLSIAVTADNCPDSNRRWVTIKNNNTSSRVYATLQTDGSPQAYKILDVSLNLLTESTPLSVGLLLLPGEAKRVGCTYAAITGTIVNVDYKYSAPGAYYPNPDTSFPSEESAAKFVRFIDRPGFDSSPESCHGSGVPTGYYFVRNAHPRKSIEINILGVLGMTQIASYQLAPEEIKFAGCNNNHLTVVGTRYTS